MVRGGFSPPLSPSLSPAPPPPPPSSAGWVADFLRLFPHFQSAAHGRRGGLLLSLCKIGRIFQSLSGGVFFLPQRGKAGWRRRVGCGERRVSLLMVRACARSIAAHTHTHTHTQSRPFVALTHTSHHHLNWDTLPPQNARTQEGEKRAINQEKLLCLHAPASLQPGGMATALKKGFGAAAVTDPTPGASRSDDYEYQSGFGAFRREGEPSPQAWSLFLRARARETHTPSHPPTSLGARCTAPSL